MAMKIFIRAYLRHLGDGPQASMVDFQVIPGRLPNYDTLIAAAKADPATVKWEELDGWPAHEAECR